MKVYPKEFFEFINKNANKDPGSLLLSHKKDNLPFDISFAVTQIECRRKYKNKLRNFISNPEFLFPAKISGEQASDDSVATYHSSFVNPDDNVLDLTGGLGIDSFTMSDSCEHITVCEIDETKFKTLLHNRDILGKRNIDIINCDSIEFLNKGGNFFDVIFVDPSRRDDSGQRVFRLSDSSPDIVPHLDLILSSCKRLYVKASPLIDLSETIKEIPSMEEFIVVMLKGECKEIFIVASNECKRKERAQEKETGNQKGKDIVCRVVELGGDGQPKSSFEFIRMINGSKLEISEVPEVQFLQNSEEIKPGQYLYEPNAGIMKLGPWDELTAKFKGLIKFSPSSHLFISDNLFPDFPGRISKVVRLTDKKSRNPLKGTPATVVSRNHPLQAEEIRKKYNLKEGDKHFIYASRICSIPVMVFTEAIRI